MQNKGKRVFKINSNIILRYPCLVTDLKNLTNSWGGGGGGERRKNAS